MPRAARDCRHGPGLSGEFSSACWFEEEWVDFVRSVLHPGSGHALVCDLGHFESAVGREDDVEDG